MPFQKQLPEYPSTSLNMLKKYTTSFGDEGITLIPNPIAYLHDRDRKVVELESAGYTLIGTFVLPESARQFDTTIGNVQIVLDREIDLAADAILTVLAKQQIETAQVEYGANNVRICRTMRFPPEAESAYEPHEYMALYVHPGPLDKDE